MLWARRCSRSGCAATRASSSPSTSWCRPQAMSRSMASLVAARRSSSRRRIWTAANGSAGGWGRGAPRPPPEPQRVARRAARHELLEAPRVELAVAEAQLVPAPARDDLRAVVAVGDRLAQLRDVELDHLGC